MSAMSSVLICSPPAMATCRYNFHCARAQPSVACICSQTSSSSSSQVELNIFSHKETSPSLSLLLLLFCLFLSFLSFPPRALFSFLSAAAAAAVSADRTEEAAEAVRWRNAMWTRAGYGRWRSWGSRRSCLRGRAGGGREGGWMDGWMEAAAAFVVVFVMCVHVHHLSVSYTVSHEPVRGFLFPQASVRLRAVGADSYLRLHCLQT